MPRYIDADILISILNGKADMALGTPKEVFYSVVKMIDCLPAADVQEVRHGHWLYDDDSGDLMCSECGHFTGEMIGDFSEADEALAEALNIPKGTIIHRSMHPFYCSGCGAKMDGGKENDL